MTSVTWELRDDVVCVVAESERTGTQCWGLAPSPASDPIDDDPSWDFADEFQIGSHGLAL